MPERRRYERTPDTIAMLTITTLAALVLTVTGDVPGTVTDLVPRGVARTWAAALAASALTTLAGTLHRSPLRGWMLELGGRIGLTLTLAAYLLAIAAGGDLGSLIAAGFVLAAALSSAVRAVQLWRRLHQWRSTAQEAVR